jgi:hypothetical protein
VYEIKKSLDKNFKPNDNMMQYIDLRRNLNKVEITKSENPLKLFDQISDIQSLHYTVYLIRFYILIIRIEI